MKKIFTTLSIMLFVLTIVTACVPAPVKQAATDAVGYYNTGQDKYVAYDQAYADALACQVFENQNIEQTMQLTYSYNWTVLQQNENYRAAKNAVAEAGAAAPKVTAADGSQVVDFSKLPAAATPDALYKSGLSFSVYAVQEAQVIPAPPEVTLKAMDAIQVANNHKFQCWKSLNAAAADYNKWRRELPGQVTAQVVDMMKKYFNIADLPTTLPSFTSTEAPGAAPNTTNPYAPTAQP